MAESPLDDVLKSLREALEHRLQEPRERANKLRAAVDAYICAAEEEAAHRLAIQNGLLREAPAITARDAADALRRLIDTLPELKDRFATIPPDESAVIPSAAAGHAEGFVYEADDEAKELLREVQSIDFDNTSIAVFRVYAAELAARARSLQERKLEAENIPGRVIRKLTAVAHAKGVPTIRGLARWHQENWDEVARRHRAARERMLELASTAAVPDMPRRQSPESEYPSIIVQEEDDEEETAVVQQALPMLQAVAHERAIVLVGGVCKREKLERVQDRFGVALDWIETNRSGMNSIVSVENRIRSGRIGALVIFDGLIGHMHFETLIHAARSAGIPFAFGDRAGMGAMARALSEIEGQLARIAELVSG